MQIATIVLTLFLHTGEDRKLDGSHFPPRQEEFRFNFLTPEACTAKALEIETAWASSPRTSISWDCLYTEDLDLI